MSKTTIPLIALILAPFICYMIYNYIEIFKPNIRSKSYNDLGCKVIGKNFKGIDKLIRHSDYFLGTSDDRVELFKHNFNITNGSIIAYHPNGDKVDKIPLEEFPNIAFHPGSMYIHNNILYVINHAYNKGGERIDSFKLHTAAGGRLSLIYQKSFLFGEEFNGMFSDLVVLSHDRFYITVTKPNPDRNDGPVYNPWNSFLNFMSTLLGFKHSYLLYCNEKDEQGNPKCKKVPQANGVMLTGMTMNEINKILYTSDINGDIKVYQLNKTYEEPFLNNTVKLDFNPIKVTFDEITNKLYVGGVSKLQQLIDYHIDVVYNNKNPNNAAHSGSYEIDVANDYRETKLVSQNSTTPVASAYKLSDAVIMTSIYGEGILKCKIENK
jgi:hypothetical protein